MIIKILEEEFCHLYEVTLIDILVFGVERYLIKSVAKSNGKNTEKA